VSRSAPRPRLHHLLGSIPLCILACACGHADRRSAPSPGARAWIPAAIAHAGVGSPAALSDGPRAAVDAALAVLEAGGEPLDAAVAGVRVMEDDPRFNAGTGSHVRLDGQTVQMDAAVMDSTGRFGAVAVIEGVKNPVEVARAVADTPHRLLAGEGATRFARALGMPPHDPATREARAKARQVQRRLLSGDPTLPEVWRRFDWRRAWNFPGSLGDAGLEVRDTVGVAVRSADGRFAVALSTGGWTILMHGRVGDVPIPGAGLHAGPHGAAAATGNGERIMDAHLAREVHRALAAGASARTAARQAVAAMEGRDVGIIVITGRELAAEASRDMAWAARAAGQSWLGPSGGR
jgi:L-asparaginase / beta-aspartyl-peptidase